MAFADPSPRADDSEQVLLRKLLQIIQAQSDEGGGGYITQVQGDARYFKLDGTNSAFTHVSTTVVGVQNGFNISGAGSIALTSTANSSINLLPGGTGNVGVGIANPTGGARVGILSTTAATTPTLSRFTVTGDALAFYGENGTAGISGIWAGTTSQRPTLTFNKTGGTLAVPTAVADGAQIFQIIGRGYDGSAILSVGSITSKVDGAVVTGLVAGRLDFAVTGLYGGTIMPLSLRSTGGSDWASQQPSSVATTPGTAVGNIFNFTAATGGNTTIATTGVGGTGGAVLWVTGSGGIAASATTASTGGAGGLWRVAAGNGGAAAVTGSGNCTGGKGGGIQLGTGGGGTASTSTGTNIGGAGGDWTFTTGNGGNATAGSTNTGGAGGAINITSGNGGAGATAAGNSGTITIGTGTSGTGGTVGSVILRVGGTAGLTLSPTTTTLVGQAGNMTITAGTGNSRTLTLQTTTSGGTATTALTIDASQNVSLANNLTLAGTAIFTKPGGTIPIFTTNTAITSGAGAQAGTLLNSPVAGNPTKWIPINDNGTTRYIPAW